VKRCEECEWLVKRSQLVLQHQVLSISLLCTWKFRALDQRLLEMCPLFPTPCVQGC
jgi:hypothetical protein